MLDISLPRYQQGIQDAVNDPRNLLFHSQISLGAVVVLAQRGLVLSPHWAATVPYADVI